VTNEPVQVEAKKVVTFQPGKIMEEKVRDAEKYTESKRRQLKGPQSVEGRSAPRDRYGKPKPSASPAGPHHSPQPDQTPENLTLPSALSDDLPEGLQ
jgi:integration host factor subunit beta